MRDARGGDDQLQTLLSEEVPPASRVVIAQGDICGADLPIPPTPGLVSGVVLVSSPESYSTTT